MTKPPSHDRSRKDTHYAKLRRAHREAGRAGKAAPSPKSGTPSGRPLPPDHVHLYGLHTVRAALDNPDRRILRMMATRNALARIGVTEVDALPFPAEMASPQEIDRELGGDAIHQGIMVEAEALPVRRLDSLKESSLLLVLDQVTDPHNVGAIMRSAVAFDAGAVITTMRHSPQESGVLAKSASGALELIPYVQITNLAEAIEELRRLGFQTVGLDSEGPEPLEESLSARRVALVMGSEGKGLRQKTRATVESLARLDMPGRIKSLNVSNAAAIALYATRRHLSSFEASAG